MLERQRVRLCCGVLLAIDLSVFLFMAAGTHGLIVPLAKPTSTDFVSFYAAGNLADAGTPELAYDRAEHYAAEERAAEVGIDYNFFYYPPTFLLLCAVLGHLPYIVAFLIFEMATLSLYLYVSRSILGDRTSTILVPLLAFPPVLWTFGLGQNAFLTAGLFGAATVLIDRRPAVAGLLFGALCYKPHFGLLVPVALAAGGYWRVFAAAFVSAAALCLLSLTVFGWETWRDFLAAAAASPAVYQSGRDLRSVASSTRSERCCCSAEPRRWLTQLRQPRFWLPPFWSRMSGAAHLPLPIRAATLAAATLAAAPLALFYDLMLAAVATAWLLRAGGRPPPCRVGQICAGGAVPLDAQSARFVRDLAPADRTPRHSGVRRFRRYACGAGQGHGPEPQTGSPCTGNRALSGSPPAGNKSSTRPIP